MILAVAPWLASGQSVSNGSFDGPVGLYSGNTAFLQGARNTTFPGWTSTNQFVYNGTGHWDFSALPTYGNLDPFGPGNTSSDGGKFAVFYQTLEDDPNLDPFFYGSVYQDITGFLPDTDYQVKFEVANMFVGRSDVGTEDWAFVARDGHFNVSLSNTVQGLISTPLINYPLQQNIFESIIGPWTEMTMTFRTDSTVTAATPLTLRFDAYTADGVGFIGTFDGGQIALDGVSISPIPEPGSVLWILSSAALMLVRRRPDRMTLSFK